MARPYTNDVIDVMDTYDEFYRETHDVYAAAILSLAQVTRDLVMEHMEVAIRTAVKDAICGDCEDLLDVLVRAGECRQKTKDSDS